MSALMIPAVSEINEDGTFISEARSRGNDSFGRDPHAGVCSQRLVNPNDKFGPKIYTPLVPYEVFERTDNWKECNLLAIECYMGTSYDNVVEVKGEKNFVIEEKIKNSERKNGVEVTPFHNTIMEYVAHEHIEVENPRYDGEMHTRIVLTNKCKFKMFKKVSSFTPKEK